MSNIEMTLEDIQNVSLYVLKEFDAFCRKHGLRYSLAYGTLIGAIRHKGFIPWDDDVDVMMPRPDYERLIKEWEDIPGFILRYPKRGQCYLTYARLCDTLRTRVITKSPWLKNEGSGIWIDIFPIDAAPRDEKATRKKYFKCRHAYRKLLLRRRVKRYKSSHLLKDHLKYMFHRLLGRHSVGRRVEAFDALCKEITYGSTPRVIDFCSPLGRKVFTYPLQVLEKYTEVEFAGEKFMAVSDYDTALRNQYGDYMQLPPESQRNCGHRVHTYLWAE